MIKKLMKTGSKLTVFSTPAGPGVEKQMPSNWFPIKISTGISKINFLISNDYTVLNI
jgi:hypothetical protein